MKTDDKMTGLPARRWFIILVLIWTVAINWFFYARYQSKIMELFLWK